MFFPVGDTPNPSRTGWATWGLIAVNVGIFLFVSLPLMNAAPDTADPLFSRFIDVMRHRDIDLRQLREHMSAYDLFIFRYGYRPAAGSVATLFSSLFLHAGWPHLVGNMIFLGIFGNNVENRLKPWSYLAMYLVAGVLATLFFSLFEPDSQVPMLGASGAISGVLGCYFLWFPRNHVKVFVFLFPFIMTVVLIPARVVLGIFLLIDNLLPFLLKAGAAAGVAHGAHIGGFLAGLAFAAALHGRAPKSGQG